MLHRILFIIFTFEWTSCRRLYENEQVLIVLSFAGLGNKSKDMAQLTFVRGLMNRSTITQEGISPIFPGKTGAIEQSFVTGLYVENHQFPGDKCFDTKLNRTLETAKELYGNNPSVVPIWIANELEGGTSGCLMWPGSEIPYRNKTCTYHMGFKENVTLNEKVHVIESWVLHPRNPANLVVVNSHNLLKPNQLTGSDSHEWAVEVNNIDRMIKLLTERLGHSRIRNRLNIAILGDQHYYSTQHMQYVNVAGILKRGTYRIYGQSPVLQVVPNPGHYNSVYNLLLNARTQSLHFDLYKENRFPARWHASNSRLAPFLVVARIGFGFEDVKERIDRLHNTHSSRLANPGVPGYDVENPEYNGFFLGNGPYFRNGYSVKKMRAVDLFQVFSEILQLKRVPPNNGSAIYKQVVKGPSLGVVTTSIILTAILIIAAVMIIYFFIPDEGRKNLIIWKA